MISDPAAVTERSLKGRLKRAEKVLGVDRCPAAQVIVEVRAEQENEHQPDEEESPCELLPGHQRVTVETMVAASMAVRSSVRTSLPTTLKGVAAVPTDRAIRAVAPRARRSLTRRRPGSRQPAGRRRDTSRLCPSASCGTGGSPETTGARMAEGSSPAHPLRVVRSCRAPNRSPRRSKPTRQSSRPGESPLR